jgi:hypothetical protein
MASDDDDLARDILWGVDGPNGIAAFLNIPPARAYYLIARKALPVRKHSHRIITASRRELRRVFAASDEPAASIK